MKRTEKESKKLYKKLTALAHIPKFLIYDKRWMKARPSFLKSTIAYNDGKYVRVGEREQSEWFEKLLNEEDFLKKPYFIAILGDFFDTAAYRVAMGIGCHAIRQGMRVRAFHATQLRWNDATNSVARPTDAVGEPVKYEVVILHGVHTDDVQMRRQLTRDFFLAYPKSFRILVLHGEEPLMHLHLKLGLNPQGIFHFPAKYRAWSFDEKEVTI